MLSREQIKKEIVKIKGKRAREITSIYDKEGNLIHRLVTPLMVVFQARDLVQVIVGASILAIPMAYTEETWQLGETLTLTRSVLLSLLSILFTAIFVYYNFYKGHLNGNVREFVKRIFFVYVTSLVVVALFLTIIDKAPWATDYILAIKRVIIVAVPASMSAAIADMIR